ncbi:ribonuclease Y [Candidatus Uhrbacteria bacterium CG22_combo_CG10-13_8_21_14_all_47_17]|uniref:Ribonuclease Y n=1 Tax=Candidatus Uhrbacteria bacterium CG22_combo_CG10-13_8_21_14_all_47_17 TaxID=1975041 RepID=A0A2H0BS37_9BACT|nr:MAG: ribonuclease Y [Candidatus Uhrbacteria bacterium CG22_combo_CG10-13_8_21_14_all_47_17]
MSPYFFQIFAGLIAGAAAGFTGGYFVREARAKKTVNNAEAKAQTIVSEAEAKTVDALQKAREKAIKILEDARLEEKRALDDLKIQQRALLEREGAFTKKLLEIDEQKASVEQAKQQLEAAQIQVEQAREQAVEEMQKAANLSKDEALERLMTLVEAQHKEDLLTRMRKLDEQSAEEIDIKAKNILSLAIQRQASSHVAETTTTYVELPSEEMKGRIIGREGRNIKAIELLTGCELIVDDTPGMVTISGFSPIRRQVAKRGLEKLIADGRIHPGRIEETIDEAKRDLALDIKKAGEGALDELGIPVSSIDPKLIQILGRLKYRTSYGQNALMHSMEVAKLSTAIAEELGADIQVCKKGGLFHDIGKAVDHDMQGSHPEIGYKIMEKFGFPEEICYQSIGHHEDKPKTLEAIIVKAADAISGARPGARKDSLDLYVKRLEELERTASSFEGVDKVYAIQAGREIRVFVNPKQIDDYEATKLARAIAARIESELKYPGEVRVTLIRETRVIEYAK